MSAVANRRITAAAPVDARPLARRARALHELPSLEPLIAAARVECGLTGEKRQTLTTSSREPLDAFTAAQLVREVERLDLDTARHLLCVLSRLLIRGDSRDRGFVYQGLVIVRDAVTAPYEDEYAEEFVPAPFPALAVVCPRSGRTASKLAKVVGPDLNQFWTRDNYQKLDDRCLPLEIVLAWVPAVFWPAVLIVIKWGAEDAQIRLTAALARFAAKELPGNRNRKVGEKPLISSVAGYALNAWLLLNSICDLATEVRRKEAQLQK